MWMINATNPPYWLIIRLSSDDPLILTAVSNKFFDSVRELHHEVTQKQSIKNIIHVHILFDVCLKGVQS